MTKHAPLVFQAARMQTIRKLLSLSQIEFGQAIETNAVTVSHWETGKHQPRRIFLERAEQLLIAGRRTRLLKGGK